MRGRLFRALAPFLLIALVGGFAWGGWRGLPVGIAVVALFAGAYGATELVYRRTLRPSLAAFPVALAPAIAARLVGGWGDAIALFLFLWVGAFVGLGVRRRREAGEPSAPPT